MTSRFLRRSFAAVIIAVGLLSLLGIVMVAESDGPAPTAADLAYFRELEKSSMHFPQFDDLAELAAVEELGFSRAKMNDAGMVHLRGLTQLKKLELGLLPITDAGLANLADLTSLEELSILAPRITDAGLAHLAGLTRLKNLVLNGLPITDAGLVHLAGMTRMKDLALIGTEIHGPGLVHLRGMVDLEVLSLACSPVDDAGLAHLVGLVRLRELSFYNETNPKITDAGLAHLAGLERLESLDLHGCLGVNDAGLAHLKEMDQLRRLELSGTSVEGPGLEHLRGSKSLKTLGLGSRFTDASLIHVAGLSGLEDLDLDNARQITEAGLDHLSKLSNLKRLTIDAHAVGPRFAEQLKKWPNLKTVEFVGGRVPDARIVELRRSSPGVELECHDLASDALSAIFETFQFLRPRAGRPE